MSRVYSSYDGERLPYLSRLVLGRLRFHWFHRGDGCDSVHDHPFDFWTFPLWGYWEYECLLDWNDEPIVFPVLSRYVAPFCLHDRKAEHTHRVRGRVTKSGQETSRSPWYKRWFFTIVWAGKRRRSWNFYDQEA